MKRTRWKSSACFAVVLAALFLGGTPAHAQSSIYGFPVGGSTQDVLNWHSGFNNWLGQMKDLPSWAFRTTPRG
jgi:hypothetical protein